MLNIPLSIANFTKELNIINIIKQLTVNNGHEPLLIDKLLIRIKYRKTRQLAFSLDSSSDNLNEYCSIPFSNDFLAQHITKVVRNNFLNIKISFSTVFCQKSWSLIRTN